MQEQTNQWMWFGKIPGLGDFAHRRVPEPLLAQIDHWLQTTLHGVAEGHPDDWVQHYLGAPVWRFIWGPGVSAQFAGSLLSGLIMPSVDRVGRYFPLIILRESPHQLGSSQIDFFRNDLVLSGLESIALQALDEDWDADRLDTALLAGQPDLQPAERAFRLLQSLGSLPPAAGCCLADPEWMTGIGAQAACPFELTTGVCLWYRSGRDERTSTLPFVMTTPGLPGRQAFERMLGYNPQASGQQD